MMNEMYRQLGVSQAGTFHASLLVFLRVLQNFLSHPIQYLRPGDHQTLTLTAQNQQRVSGVDIKKIPGKVTAKQKEKAGSKAAQTNGAGGSGGFKRKRKRTDS